MKNWFLTLALLTLSATAMAQTHPLDSAGAETLGEHWGSACRLSAGDFDDLLACNEQRSASRNFRSNPYLADNWGTQVCNMLRFQCENRSLMEDRRRKVAEIGGVLRCRSLFGKDVERACGQAPTPDTACPLGDGRGPTGSGRQKTPGQYPALAASGIDEASAGHGPVWHHVGGNGDRVDRGLEAS